MEAKNIIPDQTASKGVVWSLIVHIHGGNTNFAIFAGDRDGTA